MTAITAIKHQPISYENLCDLLGADGLTYEAIGAGLRESLKCLAHAREFYALPAWLGPDLEGFEYHLKAAMGDLEHALVMAQAMPAFELSDADVHQE